MQCRKVFKLPLNFFFRMFISGHIPHNGNDPGWRRRNKLCLEPTNTVRKIERVIQGYGLLIKNGLLHGFLKFFPYFSGQDIPNMSVEKAIRG